MSNEDEPIDFQVFLSKNPTQKKYNYSYVDELAFGSKAIVIHNCITATECEELISFMESRNHSPTFEGEVVLVDANGDKRYRNNLRMPAKSSALAEEIFSRLSNCMMEVAQDEVECTKENCRDFHNNGFGMYGVWRMHSLNPLFRLCKYDTGGHFSAHFDHDYVIDPLRLRSMKTVMIYLNDDYEGGRTRFLNDHDLLFDETTQKFTSPLDKVICGWKAKRGDCIVFDHHLLHDSEDILTGNKYIMRTEMIFNRISFTLIAEEREKVENALMIYQEGIELEKQGFVTEAIQKYRKAIKICPDIETCM